MAFVRKWFNSLYCFVFQGKNVAWTYRYSSFRIAATYFVRLVGRKQSDDDINDVENEVLLVTLSDEESSNSDNEDELDSGAAVFPNNVNTEAEEQDDEQIFRGKDG